MNTLKWICLPVLLLISAAAGASGAAETAPDQTVNDTYPGFATAALMHARLVDLPSGLILRCGEVRITKSDLDNRLDAFKPELRPKVEKDQLYMLENTVAEALLYSEAYDWSAKSKVSKNKPTELTAAYLDSRTKDVTVAESEIKQFYEDNKGDMGGMSFGQVREDISKVILDNKRLEAVTAYIAALGDRYDIEVDKTWAAKQYPIAMDNPVERARKSGKPLLVDFGSVRCPPCVKLAPILEELRKEYDGKLEMLIIDVDNELILGARYGAVVIPTQIFYDKTGKEVFRHAGFYSKANIVTKLAEIGVK